MFIGSRPDLLSELQRLRHAPRRGTSTKHALRETGVSILIDSIGTSLAAAVWLIAVLFIV